MGRLKLDILCLTLALVVVNCVVQCQYYVERPKPIYIVEGEDNGDSLQEGSEEYEALPQDQFTSRSGAPQEAEDSDEDEESDEDVGRRGNLRPNGRAPTLNLPPDFNANVKSQMRIPPRPRAPLHGDPSPIQEDDDDGRRPESRLLWPFSIEITKGDKGGKGWGHDGPSHHGSGPHHHIHHHNGGHGGHHGGIRIQHHGGGHGGHGGGGHHKRIEVRGGHYGHGSHDGWGWDAYIEHEKHKLKYEILKLKAKKKIAVLQNKVELKKLLSMMLQKKIQALEWWR